MAKKVKTKDIIPVLAVGGALAGAAYYIVKKVLLIAKFTANPAVGIPPLTVSFVNQTIGSYDSILWEFGDGQTSTEDNPTHTYTAIGDYTAVLTVGRGDKQSSASQVIKVTEVMEPAPVASFVCDVLSGYAPLSVAFTNTSTGDYHTTHWDFGDGDMTNDENPVHVFQMPGIYTVTLSVLGPLGLSTATATIEVLQKPAEVMFSTYYEGMEFTLNGQTHETPYLVELVAGTYTVQMWELSGDVTVEAGKSYSVFFDFYNQQIIVALAGEFEPPQLPEWFGGNVVCYFNSDVPSPLFIDDMWTGIYIHEANLFKLVAGTYKFSIINPITGEDVHGTRTINEGTRYTFVFSGDTLTVTQW